jgi:FAD/FMN-containing dehydrogenase
MITLDHETTTKHPAHEVAKEISGKRTKARVITNPIEEEMLWLIRRSSYTLSKLQDDRKRPAAFLEDMTVPTKHLPKFFTEVKRLFKEFNVQATVHGHAGNGHFHFYPLLDFTQKTTPALVEKMSEKFFAIAIKYEGSLCGEHNDGIIRTPYLNKMFSKKMIGLFEQTEAIFDPDDIFNPGKKVNPRFEVREVLRTHN